MSNYISLGINYVIITFLFCSSKWSIQPPLFAEKTTQNGLYYGSGPGIHSDFVVVSFISYQHCKNKSEQKVTSTNTPGEMVFWKKCDKELGTWDMTGLRPVKYAKEAHLKPWT